MAQEHARAAPRQESPAARATARLLWESSKPWPDRSAIAALVEGGADVVLAGRLAHDHQTGPLMWAALEAVGHQEQLGAAHDLLRRDYHLHRGRALLLLPTAVETAVEPLVRARLQPVLVKGPLIAARYPEPGLRPMDDLDLIVPPEQFDTAVRAMVTGGWSVARAPDKEHPYDAVLVHPSIPHLPVELHRSLSPWRELSNRMTARDLWSARVPVECFGTEVYGLGPEDELVYLCAHAGKPFHQFVRLLWSVDLVVSLHAYGRQLDWERVAWRARKSACETVVAVGLLHARRLGADVPERMVRLPASRYRRAALTPAIDESWPMHSNDAGGVRHRMRYALTDLWSRRALLLLGEITIDGVTGVPRNAVEAASRAVRRWRRWRHFGPFADAFDADARSARPPDT
jgi:hypothetical protein